jgi:predicted nuclease of predicted toxin-antitoxin system
VKFVVDMNMGHDWVAFLQKRGFNAIHWSSFAASDAKDIEIMNWARDNEAIILTQDLDFGHLHAIHNTKLPSVVQIRHDDLRPVTIGNLVCDAKKIEIRGLAKGAILTIDPPSARFRPLPIISEED